MCTFSVLLVYWCVGKRCTYWMDCLECLEKCDQTWTCVLRIITSTPWPLSHCLPCPVTMVVHLPSVGHMTWPAHCHFLFLIIVGISSNFVFSHPWRLHPMPLLNSTLILRGEQILVLFYGITYNYFSPTDLPDLIVSFTYGNVPQRLALHLPLSCNKFFEPTDMNGESFFARWKNLSAWVSLGLCAFVFMVQEAEQTKGEIKK